MTTVPASVPVLRCASQRARLDADELTRRFPKWPRWLEGDAQPMLKQMEDFARLTHTAIGYFFLPQPPAVALPVPDFRTPRDEALREPSSALLDTLYLCQQRQDWFRGHARVNGLPALAFVGSATLQQLPEAAARRMREVMKLFAAARREPPTWTAGPSVAYITAFPTGGKGSGTEATCALWSQRLQDDQQLVDDAPEADKDDASGPLDQDVDNALDAGCAVIY